MLVTAGEICNHHYNKKVVILFSHCRLGCSDVYYLLSVNRPNETCALFHALNVSQQRHGQKMCVEIGKPIIYTVKPLYGAKTE